MQENQSIEQWSAFAIPGVLSVEAGEGGQPRVAVKSDVCEGHVYLHGATVAHWQPRGEKPVIFVSRSSIYDGVHAIRGGVPICFPWFGPNESDPSLPSHGYARTKAWELVGTRDTDTGCSIAFATDIEGFHLDYTVTMGQKLHMVLNVTNTRDVEQTYESALHTYFHVDDVKRASVSGLENTEYLDKVDGDARKNQGNKPITFTQETDRVYVDTQATCVLTDAAGKRVVTVAKTGSDATVVWNPWIDKAAALGDLGDDEWPAFCCIETCNVKDNRVTLMPGGSREVTVTIGVSEGAGG